MYPPTLRAGNEFLQIRPGNEWGSANVQQIEEEEEEEVMNPMKNALTALMKTMQQLVKKVRQLQNRPTRAALKGEPNRKRLCWSAGKRDTPKEIASIRRRPNPPTRQFRETVKARNSRVLELLAIGHQRKRKVRQRLADRESRLTQIKIDESDPGEPVSPQK